MTVPTKRARSNFLSTYPNCPRLPQEKDRCDDVSMDFGNWRFNLRVYNTEPLLRINGENRVDQALMKQRREETLALISLHEQVEPGSESPSLRSFVLLNS